MGETTDKNTREATRALPEENYPREHTLHTNRGFVVVQWMLDQNPVDF